MDGVKFLLLESFEKHNSIPDTLITDDLELVEKLKDLADAFGFEIKKDKIKAVPVVLRDMKRYFN